MPRPSTRTRVREDRGRDAKSLGEPKLQGVPGGLDNAVRQAKERRLQSMYILDADCHQEEPFSLFIDYLPEPWKKRINKKDLTYDYEADPFFSRKNSGVGAFSQEKAEEARYLSGRILRSEIRESPMGPDELIRVFGQRMHDIGISQSIVLPTFMLSLGFDPRPEFETMLAGAYIDYMAEHFLGRYPDILTLIYVPGNSPKDAASLIESMGSKKGVAGLMITAGRSTLAGTPEWEPVFEAAEAKNLPVCFHGQPYSGGPFAGFDNFLAIHSLSFPFYLIQQLTSIVVAGIPERFPKLRFCFMEGGLSWIPWIMHRLDSEYVMRRIEAPVLKRLPSEYINDFYFTSQPLEHPKNIRDQQKIFSMFDSENHVMYASDYPHWDFDVPSVIYDLPFLSPTAKKKILGGNGARFFNLRS